jgi:hypothetical protein
VKQDVLDAGVPPIPKKRRALEKSLDLHLALWLDGELTPSQRRRLEAEKDRRKKLAKIDTRVVGILVGNEGVTPEQLEVLREKLAGASAIHHPYVSKSLHRVCKDLGVQLVMHDDLRDVVRASDTVIAAPPQPNDPHSERADVWSMIRYSKHRSLPVSIVLPSGATHPGGA